MMVFNSQAVFSATGGLELTNGVTGNDTADPEFLGCAFSR
jgi:hypothetical protein